MLPGGQGGSSGAGRSAPLHSGCNTTSHASGGRGPGRCNARATSERRGRGSASAATLHDSAVDIDGTLVTLDIPSEEPADEAFLVDGWAPGSLEPDRIWHDRLTEQLQPLVESLARLRDRDLLD